MSDVMRRERRRDYTIEIVQDCDCEPRDGDSYGTLVGFDLAFNGADMYVDEDERFECTYCTAGTIDGETCEHCDGYGYYTPTNVDEWVHALQRDHDIVFIRPVLSDHRGANCRYWLDAPSDDWTKPGGLDARTVGFLIYEREHIDAWFIGDVVEITPAMLADSMTHEIDEFSDWANGNCWGYRIIDDAGHEHGSMWGWIGDYDGLLDEARAEVDAMGPAQPMRQVWLTEWEIEATAVAISNDPNLAAVYSKLAQALPTNEGG